jgi:hypothetical protein
MMGLSLLLPIPMALAQSATDDGTQGTACTLEKGVYTCSWSVFKDTLAAAKTVSVQSEPMDVKTENDLKGLARHFGKTAVEPSEGPTDLQFLLLPLNKDGLYIGESELALATLRVYEGGTKTRRGKLVWAETYSGKKDMPFPSVEYYLIQQFEAKVDAK